MPSQADFQVDLSIQTITRTLAISGFEITDARRQPSGIEYRCLRADLFGALISYLIVFWDAPTPNERMAGQLAREAGTEGRVMVSVAKQAGAGWLSWWEFLEALGGAVPAWQALSDAYPTLLRTFGANRKPADQVGEPWRLFEEAVADGLEFITGRRVMRLGGGRRGQRVGDVLVMTPDEGVFVVDAKASGGPFDASWPNLRALREYIETQRTRQRGEVPVAGAVIVANRFEQRPSRLSELSAEFMGAAQATLTFVPTSTLLTMVDALSRQPQVRGSLHWRRLLGGSGLLSTQRFKRELRDNEVERVTRNPRARR